MTSFRCKKNHSRIRGDYPCLWTAGTTNPARDFALTLPERHRPTIRLTDDVIARLERVCKRRGLTRQSYILTAVEDALDRDDESLRARQEDRRPRRGERQSDEPRGLGFGRSLRETSAPAPKPAEEPTGVVVNVNQPSGGDLVPRLAAFVAAGEDSYEREVRKRAAVEMLKESGGTLDEREALSAAIGRAVEEKDKQRSSGLRGLLRGEFSLKDILG